MVKNEIIRLRDSIDNFTVYGGRPFLAYIHETPPEYFLKIFMLLVLVINIKTVCEKLINNDFYTLLLYLRSSYLSESGSSIIMIIMGPNKPY